MTYFSVYVAEKFSLRFCVRNLSEHARALSKAGEEISGIGRRVYLRNLASRCSCAVSRKQVSYENACRAPVRRDETHTLRHYITVFPGRREDAGRNVKHDRKIRGWAHVSGFFDFSSFHRGCVLTAPPRIMHQTRFPPPRA